MIWSCPKTKPWCDGPHQCTAIPALGAHLLKGTSDAWHALAHSCCVLHAERLAASLLRALPADVPTVLKLTDKDKDKYQDLANNRMRLKAAGLEHGSLVG